MEVVKFKAEHLRHVSATGFLNAKIRPWLLPEHGAALEAYGGVYTILDDGVPVVFGGIIKYWEGRGEAWLTFGKPKTSNFISIFKKVKRVIDDCPLNRIEMVVDYGSEVHARWATLLGFKKEADRMRRYLPDGGDATLYSMVRR